MLEVPEVDLHQRFYTSGLTRYPYDEIITALAEYAACEHEYMDLVKQSEPLTTPYDRYPGDIYYAPQAVQDLYKALDSSFIPSIQLGSGKEQWPVATWRRRITTYHALIRKVHKAVNRCLTSELKESE